jgi:hypothetical protein
LDSGVGIMVDYTRVVFGLHRNGHIFPMLMAIREAPSADGPPAFIGIMRPLNTTENHIVMNEDFKITAASQNSFALLGMEQSSLKNTVRGAHKCSTDAQS